MPVLKDLSIVDYLAKTASETRFPAGAVRQP
jgi:hypothetical protein